MTGDLTIVLRPSTAEDQPFLFRVYVYTRVAELAQVPWTAEEKTAFCAQQFLAQDADYKGRYPRGRFDVVEVAGEPVGRLYVAEAGDELRILDIALLPEWYGRGVGTHLLSRLVEEAREKGLTAVLHVEHFNDGARRLYERLGFAETARGEVYARMEWSA